MSHKQLSAFVDCRVKNCTSETSKSKDLWSLIFLDDVFLEPVNKDVSVVLCEETSYTAQQTSRKKIPKKIE